MEPTAQPEQGYQIEQMLGNYSHIVATEETEQEALDYILTECYQQLRDEETPADEIDDTLELFCSYYHITEIR